MSFFKASLVGLSFLLAFSLYEPIPHDIHDYWHIWKATKAVSLYHIWYKLNRRQPYEFDPIETFSTYAPPDPEIKINDDIVDGVPVRFYDPVNRKQNDSSLVIWMHGGGFIWGSVKATDKLVLGMTKQLENMLVASIEYRKAPKHIFPAAHEDCLVAVKGILKQHKRLGFNLNNVALMGASAGGNMAAVLSQQLKPQNPETPHPIKLQIMVYPFVQVFDLQTPSFQQPWTPIMPKDDIRAFGELYWGQDFGTDDAIDRMERQCEKDPEKQSESLKWTDPEFVPKHLFPKNFVKREKKALSTAMVGEKSTSTYNPCYDLRLSPLIAEDLSNLPKAYIQACEYDLIRDDAIFYEKRLREAGVDVKLDVFPRTYHGIFVNLRSLFGQKMVKDAVNFIKENLNSV